MEATGGRNMMETSEKRGVDRPDPIALIDVEQPSQARICDYLLGGSLNFAPDRQAARKLIAMVPDVPLIAQANRAFLRRAVRFLVSSGVRQFLDIGSGVPTRGNVHEVARAEDRESRVVYVDIDPVAVAHSRQILAGDDQTVVIQEDARQPERILHHPDLRGLLDMARPVAILLTSVLHFIPDSADPAGIVAKLHDAVAPGSYLALSHITLADCPSGEAGVAKVDTHGGLFASPRRPAEVERFFAGFDLVAPGLVGVRQWRPEPGYDIGADPEQLCMHAGVARKK
jgi:SAM-dependent methyltransferase